MDQNAFAHKELLFSVLFLLPGFYPGFRFRIGTNLPIGAKDRLSLTLLYVLMLYIHVF